MNSILGVLWEWRFVIVTLIAFIIYLIFEGKTRFYQLMLKAKSLAKDAVLASGKDQEDWVVNMSYKFIPYLKWVPEPKMRQIVHWLYNKAKDKLDDGKLNGSL